jgi:hypothetical protein
VHALTTTRRDRQHGLRAFTPWSPHERLVASCLNLLRRHEGLIEGSKYPDDTEVPWFASKVVYAKCGARGRHIEVRPNWKQQLPSESLMGKEWHSKSITVGKLFWC